MGAAAHSPNISIFASRTPGCSHLCPLLQLLQFIVSADAINLLHRQIKMGNMFVVQSHSLELARLAVGNFGAAQRGEEMVRYAVGFVDSYPQGCFNIFY